MFYGLEGLGQETTQNQKFLAPQVWETDFVSYKKHSTNLANISYTWIE
jgi:hypothetical protein